MDTESFLNLKMAYIIIFYLATNVIPVNVDKFSLDMTNLKEKSENLTLNFTKQKDNWWRAKALQHPDEPLNFRFDENLECQVYERDRVAQKDMIPLGKVMEITKNHKKWKKVSQVTFESKKKYQGKSKTLVFEIQKTGKQKRKIRFNAAKSSIDRKLPDMQVNWQ